MDMMAKVMKDKNQEVKEVPAGELRKFMADNEEMLSKEANSKGPGKCRANAYW